MESWSNRDRCDQRDAVSALGRRLPCCCRPACCPKAEAGEMMDQVLAGIGHSQ